VDIAAPANVIAEASISALVVEGTLTTFPILEPIQELTVLFEPAPAPTWFAGLLPYQALGNNFVSAPSRDFLAKDAALRGVASDSRAALNESLLALDGLRDTTLKGPGSSLSLTKDRQDSRIAMSAIDQALELDDEMSRSTFVRQLLYRVS
jgi:hypothetical protein